VNLFYLSDSVPIRNNKTLFYKDLPKICFARQKLKNNLNLMTVILSTDKISRILTPMVLRISDWYHIIILLSLQF